MRRSVGNNTADQHRRPSDFRRYISQFGETFCLPEICGGEKLRRCAWEGYAPSYGPARWQQRGPRKVPSTPFSEHDYCGPQFSRKRLYPPPEVNRLVRRRMRVKSFLCSSLDHPEICFSEWLDRGATMRFRTIGFVMLSVAALAISAAAQTSQGNPQSPELCRRDELPKRDRPTAPFQSAEYYHFIGRKE